MNMENNYTKGTFSDGTSGWKAVEYKKLVGFSTHEIHWSDDGECVAEVVHGEANAKLISAAPDLLEALQLLVEHFEPLRETTFEDSLVNKCKEAIKKATT